MKKILITGTAGFIGFHLAKRFIKENFEVVGIDNINDYYDPALKYARLAESGIFPESSSTNADLLSIQEIEFDQIITSSIFPNYRFIRLNLENKISIYKLFERENFDCVINLAAQAGVRYSIENPDIYIQSNIVGFFNILEACRHFSVKKLLYASSSSVYGNNAKVPFSVQDKTDSPVSLYAATKISNELMAHAYSHLYRIQTIGMRFFTVYGSWGRPDMSPILFADAISQEKPIKVFNNGEMERDFTHVNDIVEGIFRLSQADYTPEKIYQIFNIGNGNPVNLLNFIETIEKYMGKKANKQFVEMQPGDVKRTWADTTELLNCCNFRPMTSLDVGIKEFVRWYKNYFCDL